MRSALSAVLFLHGLVHVVGFIGPLELVPEAPFRTVVFGKPIANRSPAARSLAVLWLLLAFGFSVASVALFTHASWWFPFTTLVIVASMVMCSTAWPATQAGLILDAVLLVVCVFVARAQLWVDFLAMFRALSV
ncbi:MAG TPA: hypothetical protein VI299_16090 [Polyangiales bacterium]